jgi:hypothetical protein
VTSERGLREVTVVSRRVWRHGGAVLPSVDSKEMTPRAVGAALALALGMMAVFGLATWLLLLGGGR